MYSYKYLLFLSDLQTFGHENKFNASLQRSNHNFYVPQ